MKVPKGVTWVEAPPRAGEETRGRLLGEISLFAELFVGVVERQKGGHNYTIAALTEGRKILLPKVVQVPKVALLSGVRKGSIQLASIRCIRNAVVIWHRSSQESNEPLDRKVRLEID